MEAVDQEVIAKRYTNLDTEKTSGATYTPVKLAEFVAREIVASMPGINKEQNIDVLDPAAGDGELLLAIATVLKASGYRSITLHGFETDGDAVAMATSRIRQSHPDVRVNLDVGDFLKFVLDSDSGGLFASALPRDYDIVIANPPYVRTQILGATEAKRLASLFDLKGRVDLYYPFILGIGRVLRRHGVAGIITSNRYMTTKAGGSVRAAIRKHFDIRHVLDLGDTKIFGAAVLPAVLIGASPNSDERQESIKFTKIYESKSKDAEPDLVDDVVDAIPMDGFVRVREGRLFEVKHGILNDGGDIEGVWRISTNSGDEWLETVAAHTWGTFEKIGKIRVGVKTTADSVFISDDWGSLSERPELLRPLITHHSARQFKAIEPSRRREILYTHESVHGKRMVIDIDRHPKSKAYLESHRERLTSRTYVIAANRRWYEIWVPQKPDAWPRTKLVMRDISEEPCFWIDESGAVVNGDCYWMIAQDGKEDLLWLAAGVANSKFIEEFYDHKFNNKLYAGRRRFITQYVQNFPLPDPESDIAKRIVDTAKAIYATIPSEKAAEMTQYLDSLVKEAFGVV